MLAAFFVLGQVFFSTCANIFFKLSVLGLATYGFWGPFLWFQVAGNLSGFVSVLSYTMSLRYLPLHVAYPLTQGLAVLSVTFIGGWLVFHEPVTLPQWLGVLLIGCGIVLIGFTTEWDHKVGAVASLPPQQGVMP